MTITAKGALYYGAVLALLGGATACFFEVRAAIEQGARIGGPAFGLLGCGLLLAAAILLAFPVAQAMAWPWGKLMFPDKRFDRPQPLYSLAEAQARRREYEQAIRTYEQIATDFPEEVQPWIGMVEIAVTALEDVQRADAIYRRGIEQLTNVEAQNTLARMYRGIRSRLKEEPEWGKKRTIDLTPSPNARTGGRRNFR